VRRLVFLLAVGTVAVAVVVLGGPAFAHTGFSPDTAGPGTILPVTLNAADERDDAVVTQVELFFPEGVLVPARDLVAGPGWVGAAFPDHLTWTGGTADGDQQFGMTLGPFPPEPGRLQFKVLQTYSNGEVDRWIEEWPEGAPEPDMPGPFIDVVVGGPGEAPTSVAPPTTAGPPAPTTTAPAPTSTTQADDGTDADADNDDDGLGTGAIVAIVAAVLAIGAGGAYLALRARRG
jgi:hypothetical protein